MANLQGIKGEKKKKKKKKKKDERNVVGWRKWSVQ